LAKARAIICTVPEESSAATIVTAARDINPDLPIIVRAASTEGVQNLARLGAQHVVHPELEGGLEMVHHTLLQLGFPLREVHSYTDAVRRDNYDINTLSDEEHRSLHNLLAAFEGIEIAWATVGDASSLSGLSLADANVRSRTGASVVAYIRDKHLTPNPKSMTVFENGDRIGFIGDPDQIEAARNLITGPLEDTDAVQPEPLTE